MIPIEYKILGFALLAVICAFFALVVSTFYDPTPEKNKQDEDND